MWRDTMVYYSPYGSPVLISQTREPEPPPVRQDRDGVADPGSLGAQTLPGKTSAWRMTRGDERVGEGSSALLGACIGLCGRGRRGARRWSAGGCATVQHT